MNFFDKIMQGGFLTGQKTYVAAAVAILTAVASYLTGEISLNGAFPAVVAAIIAITTKAGQARIENLQKLQIAADAGKVTQAAAVKATFTPDTSVAATVAAVETKANK